MGTENRLPETMALLHGRNTIDGGNVDEESGSSSSSSSATAVLVFSTFVAVCGFFTTGSIDGYSSPAESGIRSDLGLSAAEYAFFGSVLTIGGLFGSIFCGKAADVLGRRGTIWVADIFCGFGWLSIAFAENALWLDIGRFCTGVGFAFITYVTPVYIAEITPKNLRGAYISCTMFMACLGFSTMFYFGTLISWRILALIASSASFVQILGLFLIPESPRWLAKIDGERYRASLQRLRGKDVDISEEAAEIRDYTDAFESITKTSLFSIFQRRYAPALIIGIGLMILQQLTGTVAVGYYASDVFESAGFSTSIGSRGMAIMQIPAALLSIFLMDRSGRRPLLLVSVAGLTFSYMLVGVSFVLQDYKIASEVTPTLVFIGLLLLTLSFSLGLAGIPWLIMSEIYPINIKAAAGSLSSLSYWSCSFVITYAFSFLLDWSSAGVFFVFSAVSALAIVFVAKVVPETKLRQLEEIQACISHLH